MNKVHFWIIASVLALDRITKHLIQQHLPVGESVAVIPGLFRLTHLENPGAAFSLFAGSAARWRIPILIAFSLIALVIIAVLLWKNRQVNANTIALALIFGGATGNFWDRLMRGEVTDFLDFYVAAHHWYPFNFADSAIVIGALLLAWRVFLTPQQEHAGFSHS